MSSASSSFGLMMQGGRFLRMNWTRCFGGSSVYRVLPLVAYNTGYKLASKWREIQKSRYRTWTMATLIISFTGPPSEREYAFRFVSLGALSFTPAPRCHQIGQKG